MTSKNKYILNNNYSKLSPPVKKQRMIELKKEKRKDPSICYLQEAHFS